MRDVYSGRQLAFDPAFQVPDPPLDPSEPLLLRCALGCGRQVEGQLSGVGVCGRLAGPLACGCDDRELVPEQLVADHRSGSVRCVWHAAVAACDAG